MTVSAVPPDVVAAATAAARAWLRAPDSEADGAAGGDPATGDAAAIAALATSAIVLAEAFCGRVLIARAAEETIAADTRWQALAAAPVTAITDVAAVVADGTAVSIASDGYAIDVDAVGVGWARLTAPIEALQVRVGYRAGWATGWDDLPAPIAQGIVMLVAHLFDRRDDDQAPPAAVAALWRPWRQMTLAPRRHA